MKNSYARYRDYFLNVLSAYKKKPEFLLFFEVILTFSTITIFTIFALKPTLVTITQLVKEIKAKEETISKMDAKIADLETAQDIMVSQSRQISLLKIAVPDEPSIDVLARQIEGTSVNDGVSLDSFSVDELTLVGQEKLIKNQDEAVPGGVKQISFSIRATNNFQSLTTFLDHIEKFRRPVDFDNVNLSYSTKEGVSSTSLNITGKVPYLGN